MYHTYHRKRLPCLLLITEAAVILLLPGCAGQDIAKEDQVVEERQGEPSQVSQVSEDSSATTTLQARGKISGFVKDAETGEPLPGVNVILEGTVLGATTDIDGYYVISNVPPGRYDIRISYIGYQDHIVNDVTISGDATVEASFSIGPAEMEAEEVLVTTDPPKAAPSPKPSPVPARDPPVPEPVPDPFEIDSLLANLSYGNIAFNTPPRMNLKETAYVQLLVDFTKSIAELKAMIQEEGQKEGESIKIGSIMEARLIGSHFDIESISPHEQAMTTEAVTEWKWEIRPRDVGEHQLHLTLSVVFEKNDSKRLIKTFDRTLRVEVTWGQRVSGFVSEDWQWLWAAIIVPLVGWLWKRRRETRSDG